MRERIFLCIIPPNDDAIAISEVIGGRLSNADPIEGERIAAIVFRAMAEEALTNGTEQQITTERDN
jgi:hypothetical protein